MTKTNTLNLVYISIIASLCFIINQRTAIYQCAAIFTGILVVANTYLLQSKASNIYKVLLAGITLSMPLYVIIGASNVKISIASIVSLAITGSLSIYLTNFLKNAHQFSLALFASLLVSAIVDGFIMSSYYLVFDVFASKTISILYKELSFKSLYAAIISGAIYSVELMSHKQKVKSIKIEKQYNYDRGSRSRQTKTNY